MNTSSDTRENKRLVRETARELFGSDQIQIDDKADVSRGILGSWVSAWVWVSDESLMTGDMSAALPSVVARAKGGAS